MRKFHVVVNGAAYDVDVEEVCGDGSVQAVSAAPVEASPAPQKPVVAPVAAGGTPVTSPMPGLILELSLTEGASVKENDKIIVLEAMKMENNINASVGGKVYYAVKKGDSVDTGTVLAYIR